MEELDGGYTAWKNSMGSMKRLWVNLVKMTVPISDIDHGPTFGSGKHPYRVCSWGGAANSVFDFTFIFGCIDIVV